jgi:hypothetical protein
MCECRDAQADGGGMSYLAGAELAALSEAMALSDAAATARLEALRWPHGPGCPVCTWTGVNRIRTRGIFVCHACMGKQFSVTSGTILAGSKLSHREIIAASIIFCSGERSPSSIAASKELIVNQKVAWVLFHKFREALGPSDGRCQSYGDLYALENEWRIAHRDCSIVELSNSLLILTLTSRISRNLAKYWQRSTNKREAA